MAKVLVDDVNLSNIANAIRDKNKTEDKYLPSQMAQAITDIQTGGGESELDKILGGNYTEPITINLEEIKSTNVTNISFLTRAKINFKCPNLLKIGTGAFRNSYSTPGTVELFDAPKLREIDTNGFSHRIFKKFDFPNLENIGDYCFDFYDSNYKFVPEDKISLPKLYIIGNSAFSYINVSTIEIGMKTDNKLQLGTSVFSSAKINKVILNNVSTISSSVFYRSTLETLIIKGNNVPKLSGTSAFEYTPIANGTGFIYVPDDLVEQYQTATNWVVYADQIKPLSEYTEE